MARALHIAGIRTLADLTLRVPRRRRWWVGIAGLGSAGARHIEAFFAQHPALTERARALVTVNQAQELVPWERLVVPDDIDGSRGTFRAPRTSCALDASNDYQAGGVSPKLIFFRPKRGSIARPHEGRKQSTPDGGLHTDSL